MIDDTAIPDRTMPDPQFEFLAGNISRPPLHQWLKPELVSIDAQTGAVTLRLPFRAEFRRDPERPEWHGGIIAALADMAGHAVVAAKLQHSVPTIDLRVDYLRLVMACCETPARLFGLFPAKGALIQGSDADQVIVDPRSAFATRNEDQQSRARLTRTLDQAATAFNIKAKQTVDEVYTERYLPPRAELRVITK